jgi:hypothetical protein
MRRRLAGLSYGAELLSSPLPWFVGLLLASPSSALRVAAALLLLFRYAVEASGGALARRPIPARDLPLLPLRGAAVALLFWAGLFGRRTAWRGRGIRVRAGTRIEPVPASPRLPRAVATSTAETLPLRT